MKSGKEGMFEEGAKAKKMISILQYLAKRKEIMLAEGTGTLRLTVDSFLDAANKMSLPNADEAAINAEFEKAVAAHTAALAKWAIPAAGALYGDCSQGGRRGFRGGLRKMRMMKKEGDGKDGDGRGDKDGDGKGKDADDKDGKGKDGDGKDKDGDGKGKDDSDSDDDEPRAKCANADSTDPKVKTCCAAAQMKTADGVAVVFDKKAEGRKEVCVLATDTKWAPKMYVEFTAAPLELSLQCIAGAAKMTATAAAGLAAAYAMF